MKRRLAHLLLAAGAASASADPLCENYATLVDGPYRYENNMWGRDKAKGFTPRQCLRVREVDGRREIGWTWDWAGHDRTVFAYPQIIFGWKPWSGGPPTDPRFPMRVDRIATMTMTYEVTTEAKGAYNLAPEVWLTKDGGWSEKPDPTRITTEIMFWMDSRGGATPAGQLVDRPVIGGVRYELWHMANIGDKGDGQGWPIWSFRAPEPRLSATVPLHELLAYMVAKGHVAPTEHVASIEFGNEVMGGSGGTWVRRFAVEAAEKAPAP